MNFEKHAANGNAFVNEVAAMLEIPEEKDRAGRIVRAVLHALRSRLSLAESFHLIAQLPMALKGVYVDGWVPTATEHKRIKTVDDLVAETIAQAGPTATHDLATRGGAKRALEVVVHVIKRHVSAGEVRSVEEGLPHALKTFWHAA
jgi:uncharacterized protein (DUF2267 family)